MKIKKFIIKNYRNLKEATIDFNDLTVLIGKNDVGKSNILKALDIFFNWQESLDWKEVSLGSGDNFEYKGDIKDYRLFFDQKPCTIDLVGHIELNDKEIQELFPELPAGGMKFESDHRVFIGDIGNVIVIHKQIIGEEDKKCAWNIRYIKMKNLGLYESKENKGNSLYRDKGVYNFTNGDNISAKFLDMLKRKFLIIPAVRNIEKEGRTRDPTSPNGKFIPNAYFRYQKDASLNKTQEFEQIQKHVHKIFPEYQKVDPKQYGEDERDVYFGSFPSSSVGSGVKQLFINIFNIDSYKNIVFGIEEPEIHLHAEVQRKVFNFLKEQSKNKQIIITTHSPIFANCSDKVRLYLVKKEQDKTAKIKSIEDKDEFKLIKYELGAKNTDLFFYNAVILIEGDSEERALPMISDAMGYDLVEKGIKLINITGKDSAKRKKIKEFLTYLKESDVICYLVLDKDENVNQYAQDLIGAGLLKKENCVIWKNGEFEDCFGEERIIQAMKQIAKEDGVDFDITAEQLKKERDKTKKPVTKILKQMLRDKNLFDLSKPRLAEKLALMLKEEIESKKERERTEPEEVIEKIVNLVGE